MSMITMQWEPLGQIFSCHNDLPEGFVSHAQSPQVLSLKDTIRVYFSTRKRDESGKFTSHVAYADYDREFEKIRAVSNHEVIPLGKLGTYDEHGIFPFSPMRLGGRLLAYTCGWSRRKSVSVETATGLVESFDGGKTFIKNGDGPVLAASLHQPMLVGDSFVRYLNGRYHMWYMVGTKWVRENDAAAPDRVYKIAHTVSDDGINWRCDNAHIIADRMHDNECQALPSVLYYRGLYHMVFCYRDVFGFRDNPAKAYRIGYAYSVDLVNWVRDDALGNFAPQGEWDQDMMAYPHLCEVDGQIYCLYNGNHFGRDGFGTLRLDQNGLQWAHNQTDFKDLLTHFSSCGSSFYNDLQHRVDIQAYAQKLVAKAQRLELWRDKQLIAVLAYYMNEEAQELFITHIGVEEGEGGKGFAQALLNRAGDIARQSGLERISLEVVSHNHRAIDFYKKAGFTMKKLETGTFLAILPL